MKISKRDDAYALGLAKKIKAIEILGGKCIRCGNNDIFSLDFHHNGDKLNTVSGIRGHRWSEIEAEILKCELLCANCHGELHYKNSRNGQKVKKFLLDKNYIKCFECGYKGRSLDFHHLDPENKSFTINQALLRKIKVSVNEIEQELEKCKILCRNCHRKIHFDSQKYYRLKYLIDEKKLNYKELQKPLNVETVLKMFNEGKKQKEICSFFKCGKSTISELLKKYNCRKVREIHLYNKICPNCNNKFTTKRESIIFSSKKCMGMAKRKINRPALNELLEMRKIMTLQEIANKFNVSKVSIYKWTKEPI